MFGTIAFRRENEVADELARDRREKVVTRNMVEDKVKAKEWQELECLYLNQCPASSARHFPASRLVSFIPVYKSGRNITTSGVIRIGYTLIVIKLKHEINTGVNP